VVSSEGAEALKDVAIGAFFMEEVRKTVQPQGRIEHGIKGNNKEGVYF